MKMRTEVVEADFPLLLGNSMLKRAGAVLFLREEKALILKTEVEMRETGSGHFCLKIELPRIGVKFEKLETSLDKNTEAEADSEETDSCITECLVTSVGALTLKDLTKLHNMFGHVSMSKLERLIKNANKWSDEVKVHLEEIESKCKSCKLHRKSKHSPAVSLPRTSKFKRIYCHNLILNTS